MGQAQLTVGTGAMVLSRLSCQFPNALKSHILGEGIVSMWALGVRTTRYSGGVSHTEQCSK